MGINIGLSRDVPSSLSLLLSASLPGHVRVDDGDDEVGLDQIVVTSTRTPALIRDEPLRAEALPDDEIEEDLTGHCSSLLNELPGVRLQTRSAQPRRRRVAVALGSFAWNCPSAARRRAGQWRSVAQKERH
jgi:hypothetical protein